MNNQQHHLHINLPRNDFTINVNIQLPANGISVLFGHSGAGKTSILRCVAGLQQAKNSFIKIHNDVWQDDAASIYLPTWQRSLGYVFQDACLFEHMTIEKNIHYGKQRRLKNSPKKMVDDIIELLDLSLLLNRYPQQLSGGERQRVAIARALATQPKLLLLDEPMASLDQNLRQDIFPWLEKLRDELKTPMLYVTHSTEEVVRLADHIVCIEKGQVYLQGNATDILSQPNNPIMVGDNIGAVVDAMPIARDEKWQLICVSFDGGQLWLKDNGLSLHRPVRVQIFAKDISITLNEPLLTSIQNHFACIIESINTDQHPSQAIVQLKCGNTLLLARITQRAVAQLQLTVNQQVWAQIKSAALVQ